jgi:hypothetical protein
MTLEMEECVPTVGVTAFVVRVTTLFLVGCFGRAIPIEDVGRHPSDETSMLSQGGLQLGKNQLQLGVFGRDRLGAEFSNSLVEIGNFHGQ